MSKTNLRRPQKKSTLRKRQDWDTSIGDLSQHRLSDDEASRRKQAYQSRNLTSIRDEKQRKLLAKAVHDARKTNSNQLGILREILFNERDVDELMQRSNHVLQSSRSDKFVPKSSILRSGKNHFTSLTENRARKKSAPSATRPSSTRNLNSPAGADWNHSDDDNASVSSADNGDGDDDELENEPVRLRRPSRKSDTHSNESSNMHLLNDREQQQQTTNRHSYSYSQSRPTTTATTNNGARSLNNVSFLSDISKTAVKPNGIESTGPASANQLKLLLDRLSSELNDLETITGFKSEKADSSSNTCSTALVTALLNLTGHVKQSALASKGHSHQDTNTLKDQLSVVIKAQLDFQQKVENQISMLQTMMQTVCQLVNNEIIANKKPTGNVHPPPTTHQSRLRRDQPDFQTAEPRDNWSAQNQIPRQTLLPKTNPSHELHTLTSRMSNATPVDNNSYRYSSYGETHDISKKVSRPTSAVSTNESNTYEFSKQMQPRRNIDQDSRLTMISPIDVPSSYDMFESGLPKSNSTTNMARNGMNAGLGGTSTSAPSTSANETILEKILQERLLLVQQIAELNKQHEMTQDELASLEANALQQRGT